MDMTDIDKEIANLNLPQTKPGKRIDLSVKHASLKIIVSKAWALLFFLAVALFAMYTVSRANDVNVDFRVLAVAGIVYLALGGYVSLKLWNLEFVGWLVLFYISLAGVGLPAISAFSRGFGTGTIPIMAVSFLSLVVLWLIGDLYRVKKFRDIFNPPR